MQKQIDHYDVIVIGAGPAGRSAARTAASFGAQVAIVDNSRTSGVMPLEDIAGLKLRELIRQQRGAFSGSDVWRNQIISEAHEHALHAQQMLREQIALDFLQQSVTYIEGTAMLGANHDVHIATPSGAMRTCTANNLVLATGALFVPPQGMLPDDPDVRDCQNLQFDEPLDAGLLIVGDSNSAIACASLMAALDVPVTLVTTSDRIAAEMDEEHATLLQHELCRAGIQIRPSIHMCLVERVHGKLRAKMNDGTILRPSAVRFSSDLVPNTSGLGLGKAGVQMDENGFIQVDRFFRTTAHGIYAAGDVIGCASSNEGAALQGRAAACHIFWRASKEYVDLMPVQRVSGIPELACAGLSEAQCKAQRLAYVVGRSRLDRTLRGLISNSDGQLKLLFDQSTRQLIGVHCIGNNAVDVVNIGQAIMHYGGTLDAFDAMIPIEMSYGYAYQYAAHDALKTLVSA